MSDPKEHLGKNIPGIKLPGVDATNLPLKKKENENMPESWRMGLSSQILASSNLSEEISEQTWLDDLKNDSSTFIKNSSGNRRKQMAQESVDRQGIEVVIDRLFSCMQGYMYEFNKIAVGTELHVSGTISGEVTEITRANKFREAEITETYFRARLSTRVFSLIIRGRFNRIDFFLLPVTRAMALSTVENEYPPLATVEIKVDSEGIMWRPIIIDPSCKSLESLCGWAFKQLVDETKKAISSN